LEVQKFNYSHSAYKPSQGFASIIASAARLSQDVPTAAELM